MALPNPRGVKLLVNSRVDVALAAGSGGSAPACGLARAELSGGPWCRTGFCIGVSCHSAGRGLAAAEEGADYAVFGPVFQPLSKPRGSASAGPGRAGARGRRPSQDPRARAGRDHLAKCRRMRRGWRGRSGRCLALPAKLLESHPWPDSAPRQAYSREETRRLLNISERQLKSWEQQKLVSACEAYGFRELVALRTLERLRRARVAPAQIRRALAALAEKLRHIEDPLTQLKLYADGKKIRVEVEGRAMEAESGQLLLDFDPVELNRLLEFRGRDNGQAERDKKAEAERWFQRGLELEQTGGPAEEVIEAYKKSLELDPRSAGALVNLGTIYFNARDWKQAERYYLQALGGRSRIFAGAFRPGQSLR